jgi:exopolyphosphatase / guanosine-5'-triphosphate,3'-diphosphate pyrophosphatase
MLGSRARGLPGGELRVRLVRHGRAEKGSRWDGPDALRPLTAEGLRHAKRIGSSLARSRPDRLVASPFLRCRQTLEPLSQRLRLPIEIREWLAKGEDPRKAADLLRRERGRNVVCCTHTELLAEIESELEELGVEARVIGRGAPAEAAADGERLAVVDLGSTSFHMLVADVTPAGGLVPVARSRAMLELGSWLAVGRRIPEAAQAEALRAAARLRRRAAALGVTRLLPVGTAALREAANGAELRRRLGEALDAPVRLLSGVEEARLMFAAFRRRVLLPGGPVLGADLGGGSLELAIGDLHRIRREWTLRLGAARLRAELAQEDPIPTRASRAIRERVRELAEPVAAALAGSAPEIAVAAGGTARALGRLVVGLRGLRPARSINELFVPAAELRAIARHLVATPRAARLRMPGMRRRRVDLLPVGTLVLTTLADVLELEGYTLTDWGLREGVLLEAVGIRH